mmetsp:Transcript_115878/g.374413  ORF Transcript_115878/g.374413 Transcript_115878/m.374413 type:complete len:272 (-) Transcript_115878:790-1605(-)
MFRCSRCSMASIAAALLRCRRCSMASIAAVTRRSISRVRPVHSASPWSVSSTWSPSLLPNQRSCALPSCSHARSRQGMLTVVNPRESNSATCSSCVCRKIWRPRVCASSNESETTAIRTLSMSTLASSSNATNKAVANDAAFAESSRNQSRSKSPMAIRKIVTNASEVLANWLEPLPSSPSTTRNTWTKASMIIAKTMRKGTRETVMICRVVRKSAIFEFHTAQRCSTFKYSAMAVTMTTRSYFCVSAPVSIVQPMKATPTWKSQSVHVEA